MVTPKSTTPSRFCQVDDEYSTASTKTLRLDAATVLEFTTITAGFECIGVICTTYLSGSVMVTSESILDKGIVIVAKPLTLNVASTFDVYIAG
jgi:hypothetical protein